MASFDLETLLTRNLHEVFGENDAARRRAAIEDIFHEDAVFYEPAGVHRGWDEIDSVAGIVKAMHPEYRYTPIRPVEQLHDRAGRIQWVSGAPDAPPEYAGTDVIVARDGRIETIYLFFDALPA